MKVNGMRKFLYCNDNISQELKLSVLVIMVSLSQTGGRENFLMLLCIN